ncbi:MAG: xanthine dehydrogenase molybdopterin binding subunit [Candidatus Loosdrechtia sp.]|uniref:xanthine dehydrogenase molybdopterin binding subunit n=1 Tax=Candidatus Loosdrechtia sp. TaxID=3101272 RepID=UPI003A7776DD|nr:MAG: molybdopterin-dependent oxidoreductase [Candidatus Jettenia sp. AMX2]
MKKSVVSSRNLPHDSAHTHVTGESEYISDRAFQKNEVFVEIVYSTEPHALIKKINTRKSLKVPGVLGIFSAKDLCNNVWGTIIKDQPLLADGIVRFAGEAILLIAAETREAARMARNLVVISCQSLEPILSIREARQHRSFIGNVRIISRGNVKKALAMAPHTISGHLVIQGADHFYLESQSCIVYPLENDQIEIHSSSQHPAEVQHVAASAVGLPYSKVVCIVKRMGGAFGGKESQAVPFAAYASLVARKLKRPARIALTKDDDMIMTGKRNPFEIDYRAGFDSDGRILAAEFALFSDGGAYADLSTSIMERAMLHCDNAYFIPHFRATGQVCKTNFHPHTAFRGFGGPKGVAAIENVIEEIAHYLKKDALEIRKLNVYSGSEGRDITPYGQKVENNCLPELFNRLEKSCGYYRRKKEIQKYNGNALKSEHIKYLRGLSLTAVKFGIAYTARFLNQANALVLVHRDGTLQVSTGATEMGQGVNARIAQLVAEEFGLPRNKVVMMPTSTEKNANTSPTAASSGTDLNGAAAVIAARRIKSRLSDLYRKLSDIPESKWASHTVDPGKEEEINVRSACLPENDPNFQTSWESGKAVFSDVIFSDSSVYHRTRPEKKIPFSSLVQEAYYQRISLSEYGFYKFPDISFHKASGEDHRFLYYTQGVAASEVSIDRDTGAIKVLRTDILMDLGRLVNEALDIGQITGGFIQGMGWLTTENLCYSHKGLLLSNSPATYKIPVVQDAPRIFNINLMPNNENRVNIRGTKAAGEPPLLLSISVWTAIKHALTFLPGYKNSFPQLNIPATSESILRLIQPDEFLFFENFKKKERKE